MRYRQIGDTGVTVSEVGFGVWTVSAGWWGEYSDEDASRLMHAALERGVTLFDTAALYGFGPPKHRKWIMVDLGMGFASEEHMPGVDLMYPDLSFAEEHRENLLGILITHGHEDHIGAIGELWPKLKVPVYATRFTKNLIEARRLGEPGAPKVDLREVPADGRLDLGPFSIEYVPVAHSIPEANALAIRTPLGLVLHTGDWKLDDTPVAGNTTSEETFTRLGEEGVLALVCDSTNVTREGRSPSESEVSAHLAELIRNAPHRVAVTTFAHLSTSRFTNAVNCAVLSGAGSAPCALKRSRTSAVCTIRRLSAEMRSTIGIGVPAGAKRPSQLIIS